jgi:hypothetical protein
MSGEIIDERREKVLVSMIQSLNNKHLALEAELSLVKESNSQVRQLENTLKEQSILLDEVRKELKDMTTTVRKQQKEIAALQKQGKSAKLPSHPLLNGVSSQSNNIKVGNQVPSEDNSNKRKRKSSDEENAQRKYPQDVSVEEENGKSLNNKIELEKEIESPMVVIGPRVILAEQQELIPLPENRDFSAEVMAVEGDESQNDAKESSEMGVEPDEKSMSDLLSEEQEKEERNISDEETASIDEKEEEEIARVSELEYTRKKNSKAKPPFTPRSKPQVTRSTSSGEKTASKQIVAVDSSSDGELPTPCKKKARVKSTDSTPTRTQEQAARRSSRSSNSGPVEDSVAHNINLRKEYKGTIKSPEKISRYNNDPQSIVGREIIVWWPENDACFIGKIKKWLKGNEYNIYYFIDRRTIAHNLMEDQWCFVYD